MRMSSKWDAAMVEALGRATDAQLQAVADLLASQASTVRAMQDQPASGRLRLAEQYTQLRLQTDLRWLAVLGLGIKMVCAPDGTTKAVGYVAETGEPIEVQTIHLLQPVVEEPE